MTNKELYAKLTAAPNLQKALVEHFTYLADSDRYMPVLEQIMSRAKSVEMDGDNLVIHFPGDNEMSCNEPAAEGYEKWPLSFQKVVGQHEFISFPDDGGWALELGESGNFEPEMLEDGESGLDKLVDDLNDILCPFSDYSDWWIYHPTEKNPQGEPMLCLASHESCDIDERVDCNVGSLFLKRVLEYFGDVGADDDEAIYGDDIYKTDDDWSDRIEQASINAGIGSTGTLIKHDCDYAMYVYKQPSWHFFHVDAYYPVRSAAYPSGRWIRYTIWADEITKAGIMDELKSNPYENGSKQYVLSLDGKEAKCTQPCDRVKILEWLRIGGWDKDGKLILAVKYLDQPKSGVFVGKIAVETFQYVGYVKDGEFVFDENCGIADDVTVEESAEDSNAEIEKAADFHQTAVAAGIGREGTLIRHECDYALYSNKKMERKDTLIVDAGDGGYDLFGFYPDGSYACIRY